MEWSQWKVYFKIDRAHQWEKLGKMTNLSTSDNNLLNSVSLFKDLMREKNK